MKILAHRGGAGRHPENSLEAFLGAAAQGVDGIETDVRLTADGELVLVHDRILPDGRPLATLSARELDLALSPLRPPRVAEVLDTLPDLLWNLEIKAAAALPPLLRLLRRHRTRERVVLTSFDHGALQEHAADQGLRLGALIAHRPGAADLHDLQALGGSLVSFDLVVWAFETLDPWHVECLSECNTKSWVYGPTTWEEHRSLADLPLEAVITDHPERADCLRAPSR